MFKDIESFFMPESKGAIANKVSHGVMSNSEQEIHKIETEERNVENKVNMTEIKEENINNRLNHSNTKFR
jgi:hypothetical protein